MPSGGDSATAGVGGGSGAGATGGGIASDSRRDQLEPPSAAAGTRSTRSVPGNTSTCHCGSTVDRTGNSIRLNNPEHQTRYRTAAELLRSV